jgi:hypothetical protein
MRLSLRIENMYSHLSFEVDKEAEKRIDDEFNFGLVTPFGQKNERHYFRELPAKRAEHCEEMSGHTTVEGRGQVLKDQQPAITICWRTRVRVSSITQRQRRMTHS